MHHISTISFLLNFYAANNVWTQRTKKKLYTATYDSIFQILPLDLGFKSGTVIDRKKNVKQYSVIKSSESFWPI